MAFFSQAEVRVVVTEQQPVFRSGCQQAVGFIRPFSDKIIDQYADVGVGTAQDERFLAEQFGCSIDAGDEALTSRLFITASGRR